nr:MAG TPA: hypothetical protein [Caudoviricetes sp.]
MGKTLYLNTEGGIRSKTLSLCVCFVVRVFFLSYIKIRSIQYRGICNKRYARDYGKRVIVLYVLFTRKEKL